MALYYQLWLNVKIVLTIFLKAGSFVLTVDWRKKQVVPKLKFVTKMEVLLGSGTTLHSFNRINFLELYSIICIAWFCSQRKVATRTTVSIPLYKDRTYRTTFLSWSISARVAARFVSLEFYTSSVTSHKTI